VTGGTGSFGTTIARRFLQLPVREIRVFSRDEKKQDDMRLTMRDDRLKFYIGDVRDAYAVSDAVAGIDYVFHAAALKQVPSCEFYPMEAVKTNVLGAENVMRACIAQGAKRCVLLSTDKAVYPINAMGMSKALMEKAMVAMSRTAAAPTVFCATRYGNVMASRGSVIPLFIEQLTTGKPLTVTDPRMTRFLMSLEQSVDLVLHAFEYGSSGDIFVQKAPASTIGDLAAALRDLIGPGDAPIRIIGTRHGEKLFESLVSREEMARAEDIGDYFRIPADGRDLIYDRFFSEGETEISELDDYTSHNTRRLDLEETKQLMMTLPEVKRAIHA
jgi:UDP-N-acetylglucosamine 4,6-dehydratase/5-epimerase